MLHDIRCGDSASIDWSGPAGWPPIAAIFTSPPYNCKVNYGLDPEGRLIKDDLEADDYRTMLWHVLRNFRATTCHYSAALFLNHKPTPPDMAWALHRAALDAGWTHQHTWAWVYATSTWGHFQPIRGNRPHSSFELVSLYHRCGQSPVRIDRLAVGVPYADKSNRKRFNAAHPGEEKPDVRCRGSVWEIPYPTKRNRRPGDPKGHPCPFPPELPEMALKMLSLPPGSVVADPFMGVGNTGRAAVRLGFRFVGADRNPDYCAEAVAALEDEEKARK